MSSSLCCILQLPLRIFRSIIQLRLTLLRILRNFLRLGKFTPTWRILPTTERQRWWKIGQARGYFTIMSTIQFLASSFGRIWEWWPDILRQFSDLTEQGMPNYFSRLPWGRALEENKLSSWDQICNSAGFLSTIRDPAKSSGQGVLQRRLLARLLLFCLEEASQQALQEEWFSAKFQVYLALLWMRQDLSPFASSTTWFNATTWLPHLQAFLVDPADGFWGLLDPFTF